MPEINIREIRPPDDPEIASIIRSTLAEFKANKPGTVYYDDTTDHLSTLFQVPNSAYSVLTIDGLIAGGAGIFPSKGLPPDVCELVKMYLKPAARGLGLGRRLIEYHLEIARGLGYRKVYLETMPELKNAVSVYERLGFTYLSGPMGDTGHFGCDIWMVRDLYPS